MKPNFNKKAKTFMDRLGYVTEIVEHYNAFSRRKNDFCGFADAISFNPDSHNILAIQITSISNISTRWNKITKPILKEKGDEYINPVPAKAKAWLKAGGGIWILGFDSKSKAIKIRKIDYDKQFTFEETKYDTVPGK
jgi:hypothetical protein